MLNSDHLVLSAGTFCKARVNRETDAWCVGSSGRKEPWGSLRKSPKVRGDERRGTVCH